LEDSITHDSAQRPGSNVSFRAAGDTPWSSKLRPRLAVLLGFRKL
jgi:hypothetical protein